MMAMNCDTFTQNIDAYLDGELTGRQRADMDAHADECGDCRVRLEQAIELSALCAGLNEGLTVPLPAQAAWRKAIRAQQGRKRSPIRRWTYALGTVAAALVVLVTGTFGMRGWQSAPASTGSSDSTKIIAYRPYSENQTEAMGGVTARSISAGSLHADGSLDAQQSRSAASAEAATETVVLRSAERSIRTGDYDADFMWLENLTAEYDAWFEERVETRNAQNDPSTGRVASAVVRVPSDRLDDFLTELDQLGQTVMSSESAEDVTGKYVDTQSRLNALQAQKDKLNDMLAGCENVEELIAIDDKLTEVIASMEKLTGDLMRWESQRSYSRVALTLTELDAVAADATLPLSERMRTGFDESVDWLGEFGQDAMVALATAAPRLVVWIPAAALLVIVLWAIFRRRGK